MGHCKKQPVPSDPVAGSDKNLTDALLEDLSILGFALSQVY